MNKFDRFGIMVDSSRNGVMTVSALKRWMDLSSDIGYNALLLYTEDTYEIKDQPYFGHLRGRYSVKELCEIEEYAMKKNMEFIPCIQTLAHLNSIFRWDIYKKINDCGDILLAGDENTYKLIDDMFSSFADNLKTRVINIGMDEAYLLGRGKYLDATGNTDKMEILISHLNRVCKIAEKYGFRIIMWGDMFIRIANNGDRFGNANISDSAKKKIPEIADIVYWDYHSTDYFRYIGQMKIYREMKESMWFAGGFWNWLGFAPHNSYAINTIKASIPACIDNGVKNVFMTTWGDNGSECSRFSALPSLFYASEMAKGIFDEEIIKNHFKDKYGISFDDFMLLELRNTPNDRADDPCNADKFMLYNDIFMGQFDYMVKEGISEKYLEASKKLSQFEDNKEFGIYFKTLSKLSLVLSEKYDIGVKTRKYYLSNDKRSLLHLIKHYDKMISYTEDFYYSFRDQWLSENKPHGFDAQDIRLGGLIQRMKHCRETVLDFCGGKIDSIPELEEPVLNRFSEDEKIRFNKWNEISSANIL